MNPPPLPSSAPPPMAQPVPPPMAQPVEPPAAQPVPPPMAHYAPAPAAAPAPYGQAPVPPAVAYGPVLVAPASHVPVVAILSCAYGILITVLALLVLTVCVVEATDVPYEEMQTTLFAAGGVSAFLLGTWAVVCFCIACVVREAHAARVLLEAGVFPPPPTGRPPSVPFCTAFARAFAIIDTVVALAVVALGFWLCYKDTGRSGYYGYRYHSEPDTDSLIRCLIAAVALGLWPVLLFGLARACCAARAVLERLRGDR